MCGAVNRNKTSARSNPHAEVALRNQDPQRCKMYAWVVVNEVHGVVVVIGLGIIRWRDSQDLSIE